MTRASFLPRHTPLVRTMRRVFWTAQQGKCGICGKDMHRRFGSPKLTFDHVWPKSKSVLANAMDGNFLLTHDSCNNTKADRLPKGCELVMLFATNRRLGMRPHETLIWDDMKEIRA